MWWVQVWANNIFIDIVEPRLDRFLLWRENKYGRLLMHQHGLAIIYMFLHFSNLIEADELEFGLVGVWMAHEASPQPVLTLVVRKIKQEDEEKKIYRKTTNKRQENI